MVIEFSKNWEPVYDFVLVINSNIGPISHRYWDTVTYLAENHKFFQPLSHLVPSFEVTPSNLWKSLTVPETKVF